MNSDFMQQQGELLARARVSTEPDDARADPEGLPADLRPRCRPTPRLPAGMAYVSQEPMRAYEERKAEAAKTELAAASGAGGKAATAPDQGPVRGQDGRRRRRGDDRRRDDGRRRAGRGRQKRRRREAAARHDVGPVPEDAAQLERISSVRRTERDHVRTHCAIQHRVIGDPAQSHDATRCAASATASACWPLPAWSASRSRPRLRRLGQQGARGARKARTIRPRAKRVIFLFMNGGLSQVDSFDPKPMLDKYHGQPLPGGSRRHRAQDRRADAVAVHLQEVRPERHRGQRAVPACRRVRRRHLRHPLDVHRHPESRAVDADDEHRPHAGRPAVDRIVAHLRAGHRQQEPARLRRALSRRADHGRAAAVEQRVPAGRAPGHVSSPSKTGAGRTRSSARTSIRRSWSPTSTTRSSR